MILLVFASPLASIVRLCFMLYDHFYRDLESTANSSENDQPFSFDLLTNSTIEDIIDSFLSLQFGSRTIMYTYKNHQAVDSNNPTLMYAIHNDLQQVLPWVITISILLISTFFHALVNRTDIGRHYMYPGEMSELEQRKRKFMKRVRRLIACLENYEVELSNSDFYENKDGDTFNGTNGGKSSNSSETQIKIPAPGETKISQKKHQISNTCAICLSEYVPGQNVVWSSNAKCCHVFHKHCFVNWIEKRGAGQCPCCRQDFVDKAVYSEVKRSTGVPSS